MAYDRYDNRGGWREPRSRFSGEDRGRDRFGRDDRGFFERAGDEVASWFGDEDAERRRRMDSRQDRYDRPDDDSRRAFMSDDDYSRYDRQPRFRDEGYRRPYTGRFSGGRDSGSEGRYRPFTGDYSRTGGGDWDEERSGSFSGMASTSGSIGDPH